MHLSFHVKNLLQFETLLGHIKRQFRIPGEDEGTDHQQGNDCISLSRLVMERNSPCLFSPRKLFLVTLTFRVFVIVPTLDGYKLNFQ